jgi:hypothetical protein
MGIEESIAVFEMLHLKTNQTGGYWTHHSTGNVIFMIGTNEKIHIIWMSRKTKALDCSVSLLELTCKSI